MTMVTLAFVVVSVVVVVFGTVTVVVSPGLVTVTMFVTLELKELIEVVVATHELTVTVEVLVTTDRGGLVEGQNGGRVSVM